MKKANQPDGNGLRRRQENSPRKHIIHIYMVSFREDTMSLDHHDARRSFDQQQTEVLQEERSVITQDLFGK